MKKQYIIILAVLLGLIVLFFYFKEEKVYTYKEYSPSGKLISTNEYLIRNGNPIQDGKFVNYNEKGIKIAEGNFVNNEINGKSVYYFGNGKIESVHYRKSSKITEESTFYNFNGSVRKYIMYNNIGDAKFVVDFQDKAVTKYDGYTLLPLNQYKINNGKQIEFTLKDTLKVGDIIKYDYVLANIPYTKRTFKIETVGIDNSKVKRTIVKKAPTSIIVEEVLTKKGFNRIKAITQYTFDDKVTPVKNDTVSFDVNVK